MKERDILAVEINDFYNECEMFSYYSSLTSKHCRTMDSVLKWLVAVFSCGPIISKITSLDEH